MKMSGIKVVPVFLLLLFQNSWATDAASTRSLPGNAQEEAITSFIFVFRSDFPADRVPEEAVRLSAEHGGLVRHTFKVALKGFSATLSAQAAARLAERNPHIAYYERNGVVSAIDQANETAARVADRARPDRMNRLRSYRTASSVLAVPLQAAGVMRG